MASQREIWEGIHEKEWWTRPAPPEAFAIEVEGLLGSASRILELGCGDARDAAFFAGRGHEVIATDFTDVALEKNRRHYTGTPCLAFLHQDISQPLCFGAEEFDLVYARLSLHYFSDAVTKMIFQEIERVLRNSGLLAFMCKSLDDPLYGKGVEIEKDMFETSHVRHFFSEAYARKCLGEGFAIESLTSLEQELYGFPSAYIRVLARKKG
jgi:SAM-dependent methyltransferase